MYGYSSKGGIKVYESDALENKYLITSNQTVFSVEYLYEMTLQILHSNATFLALADIFQALHVFNRHSIARADVNRKRITDAWFLYAFLELSSRYGLNPKFYGGDNWLEDSIIENYNALKLVFSSVHFAHKCDVTIIVPQ